MKIHRLVYVKWRGIDLRCKLEQTKSMLQGLSEWSDIYIDVWGVRWGATGIEFCGCIGHEHLPDVVRAMIHSKDTSLQFRSAIPHRHKDIWAYHKQSIRDEWTNNIIKVLDKIADSNIQQMQIEF